MLLSNIIIQIR